VNGLDRFSHTPYDDAIREGYPAIAGILKVGMRRMMMMMMMMMGM
jgi:hypothetical protein